MMLPRLAETSFWKDLLSRFSFPLELCRNVVTTFFMASSMSVGLGVQSIPETQTGRGRHSDDARVSIMAGGGGYGRMGG